MKVSSFLKPVRLFAAATLVLSKRFGLVFRLLQLLKSCFVWRLRLRVAEFLIWWLRLPSPGIYQRVRELWAVYYTSPQSFILLFRWPNNFRDLY